jgi:hypothetical protein
MSGSFSPLQLFSPVQLVFCLILFFLPWIELSCQFPPELVKDAPKEELEQMKKEFGVDPTRPIGLVTQSGLQIASGDASVSSDFEKLSEKKGGAVKNARPFDPKREKKDGETAPLLYLFPVAVVAGIVLGFVPWPGVARKAVLAGCCLLALGVVGIQAAIGFPLDKEIAKQKDQLKGFGGGGGIGFGAPGAKAAPGGKDADIFRVRWKLPLYLTLLLLLGAAGTAFLGPNAPTGRKPKRRPVRDYDDDDEDEEDEEDRPRRKKPSMAFEVVDEEDEDDRPRKKRRRDEDDEDDDRPRKRRRRDDD